jgi:hypothetical protein
MLRQLKVITFSSPAVGVHRLKNQMNLEKVVL